MPWPCQARTLCHSPRLLFCQHALCPRPLQRQHMGGCHASPSITIRGWSIQRLPTVTAHIAILMGALYHSLSPLQMVFAGDVFPIEFVFLLHLFCHWQTYTILYKNPSIVDGYSKPTSYFRILFTFKMLTIPLSIAFHNYIQKLSFPLWLLAIDNPLKWEILHNKNTWAPWDTFHHSKDTHLMYFNVLLPSSSLIRLLWFKVSKKSYFIRWSLIGSAYIHYAERVPHKILTDNLKLELSKWHCASFQCMS